MEQLYFETRSKATKKTQILNSSPNSSAPLTYTTHNKDEGEEEK